MSRGFCFVYHPPSFLKLPSRAGEVFVTVLRDFDRVGGIGVLVFLLTCFAFGQQNVASDQASIRGTVADQSQAVLTGASVVLSNGSGFKQETKTDEKGAYSFTSLKAGTYTITITAPDFEQKTLDYINLTAGLELTLDTSLEPAIAKTEVNVESSGVGKVETENASVS